jgi:voltage-gated potassium channel
MAPTASPAGRPRRRRTLTAFARSVLTAVLITVAYYRAPLQGSFDARAVLLFALGLFALAVSVAWQARAIAVSDTPRLRAVETVMVALPVLLFLYASAYVLVANNDPASFTEAMSRTDALYYTMTVFSTVGFGDITPTTVAARVLTMTQMIAGLVGVGIVAKLLLGAVAKAVDGGRVASEPAGRDDPSRPARTDPPRTEDDHR